MRTSDPPKTMTQEALRVREVLLRWDPIGVTDEPGWPEDEYDDLIVPILAALGARMPDEILASELWGVIRDDYGLTPSRASCRAVARELLAGPIPD